MSPLTRRGKCFTHGALRAVCNLEGERWRRRSPIRSWPKTGTLPLGRGLLLFVPLIFAGNLVGVFLRYPDHGAAILFPPYAALTAVLLASRRRDWIVYIVVATSGPLRHEHRAVALLVGRAGRRGEHRPRMRRGAAPPASARPASAPRQRGGAVPLRDRGGDRGAGGGCDDRSDERRSCTTCRQTYSADVECLVRLERADGADDASRPHGSDALAGDVEALATRQTALHRDRACSASRWRCRARSSTSR